LKIHLNPIKYICLKIKFIDIQIDSTLKYKIIKAIKESDMVRDEIKGNLLDD